MNNYNHNFLWDETMILVKENNSKKRLISEMMFINSFNNTLNRIEVTQKLNNIYKSSRLN